MSTIPSYSERLRAMIFKIDFQDKVKEIKPVGHIILVVSVKYSVY